jgi:hypothetical protein
MSPNILSSRGTGFNPPASVPRNAAEAFRQALRNAAEAFRQTLRNAAEGVPANSEERR